jgi:hypothetical protein
MLKEKRPGGWKGYVAVAPLPAVELGARVGMTLLAEDSGRALLASAYHVVG